MGNQSFIQAYYPLNNLKSNLYFTDNNEDACRGVGFYIAYQGLWSPEMIEQWEYVSKLFISYLKRAIRGPALKCNQSNTYQFWKVPIRMPKLHAFVGHVSDFFQLTGFWALYGEESFEHFQQVCHYARARHAHNMSTGSYICSNFHYTRLRSLPSTKSLQITAE